MTAGSDEQKSTSLPVRIAAAWIITLVALALSGWIGEIVETSMGAGARTRYGLQAVIMAGLVVAGIWWLRTRLDRKTMEGLGLPGLNRSITFLGFGFGIIAIPTAAILSLMVVVGWGAVNVDLSAAALGGLAVAIATAFLFEALPEELAFRGYIYRNLNTVYRRWAAAALTVVLFVLLPVILVPIQRNILGMDISVGATNHITVDYLIIMTIFGSFVQYLRILTGNVWTSIGFHLAFLLVNRIMGPVPSRMIYVADVAPDAPMQIVVLVTVVLVLGGLIAWPYIKKSPLGWNERDPE